MAVKQTFNKAPKLKIVAAIANALSGSEEGELYYDAATEKLNLRVDSGWITFAID